MFFFIKCSILNIGRMLRQFISKYWFTHGVPSASVVVGCMVAVTMVTLGSFEHLPPMRNAWVNAPLYIVDQVEYFMHHGMLEYLSELKHNGQITADSYNMSVFEGFALARDCEVTYFESYLTHACKVSKSSPEMDLYLTVYKENAYGYIDYYLTHHFDKL